MERQNGGQTARVASRGDIGLRPCHLKISSRLKKISGATTIRPGTTKIRSGATKIKSIAT